MKSFIPGKIFTSIPMVGQSRAFSDLMHSIREVGASSANVLITGESGTGKELAARAIHRYSRRGGAPFVAVNCAAIPEFLLESELFGHCKGAFTGAVSSRVGRFAQADSGTLFLDEIGDMPLTLQAKILRCVQEKTVDPLGSSVPLSVDVRIIAATNQDLEKSLVKGSFRRDLYYRLNVYPLRMPPLRERKEDIPLLACYFAESFAEESGAAPLRFTDEAMEALLAYDWPGNIRELENYVERLHITVTSGLVTPSSLEACAVPTAFRAHPIPLEDSVAMEDLLPLNLEHKLKETERSLLLRALKQSGGVQVKAAELLDITERSMWHRVKKYGIDILTIKEIS